MEKPIGWSSTCLFFGRTRLQQDQVQQSLHKFALRQRTCKPKMLAQNGNLAPLWCHVYTNSNANIHPWNLRWNLKRIPWKRRFLLETIIFRFHVKFRGSICKHPWVSFRRSQSIFCYSPWFNLVFRKNIKILTDVSCFGSEALWGFSGRVKSWFMINMTAMGGQVPSRSTL